jgi:hypothetical protein
MTTTGRRAGVAGGRTTRWTRSRQGRSRRNPKGGYGLSPAWRTSTGRFPGPARRRSRARSYRRRTGRGAAWHPRRSCRPAAHHRPAPAHPRPRRTRRDIPRRCHPARTRQARRTPIRPDSRRASNRGRLVRRARSHHLRRHRTRVHRTRVHRTRVHRVCAGPTSRRTPATSPRRRLPRTPRRNRAGRAGRVGPDHRRRRHRGRHSRGRHHRDCRAGRRSGPDRSFPHPPRHHRPRTPRQDPHHRPRRQRHQPGGRRPSPGSIRRGNPPPPHPGRRCRPGPPSRRSHRYRHPACRCPTRPRSGPPRSGHFRRPRRR